MHADPEHRERVVETYNFTIKYHVDGKGGKTLAGLELDSPGEVGLTVEATNLSLHSLLRHIMDLCDGLPELPGILNAGDLLDSC